MGNWGEIRMVGDWQKVALLIQNMAMEMEKAKITSLQRFGLKMEEVVLNHISMQDMGWKPLDPKYIESKVRKGLSENILVATSDYFNAIQSWVDKDSQTTYIGVKKGKIDKDGNEIGDIAQVHEYGSMSGKIPKRPLWEPSFKDVKEWYYRSDHTPDKIFIKEIQKYL